MHNLPVYTHTHTHYYHFRRQVQAVAAKLVNVDVDIVVAVVVVVVVVVARVKFKNLHTQTFERSMHSVARSVSLVRSFVQVKCVQTFKRASAIERTRMHAKDATLCSDPMRILAPPLSARSMLMNALCTGSDPKRTEQSAVY